MLLSSGMKLMMIVTKIGQQETGGLAHAALSLWNLKSKSIEIYPRKLSDILQ
jgi:hypothetical protein